MNLADFPAIVLTDAQKQAQRDARNFNKALDELSRVLNRNTDDARSKKVRAIAEQLFDLKKVTEGIRYGNI